MLEWLGEVISMPSRFWNDVRKANKSTGGVTRANGIAMFVCLALAAASWWLMEWPVAAITLLVVSVIALFWTSEHFEMLKKIIPYTLAAAAVGPAIGGIAMYFGAPFQQVTMMVAIATFIVLSLRYGL